MRGRGGGREGEREKREGEREGGWLSGCHSTGFSSPTPQIQNARIRVFTRSNMILLQILINLMIS